MNWSPLAVSGAVHCDGRRRECLSALSELGSFCLDARCQSLGSDRAVSFLCLCAPISCASVHAGDRLGRRVLPVVVIFTRRWPHLVASEALGEGGNSVDGSVVTSKIDPFPRWLLESLRRLAREAPAGF